MFWKFTLYSRTCKLIKFIITEFEVWDAPPATPQLSKQTLSRGAAGFIFTTYGCSTTVYSLNVEHRNLEIGVPFMENRDFPSLFMPVSRDATPKLAQWFVFGEAQYLQTWHSPVKTGITWSPAFRSVTPLPTLSTILQFYAKASYHYLDSNPPSEVNMLYTKAVRLVFFRVKLKILNHSCHMDNTKSRGQHKNMWSASIHHRLSTLFLHWLNYIKLNIESMPTKNKVAIPEICFYIF